MNNQQKDFGRQQWVWAGFNTYIPFQMLGIPSIMMVSIF